jgi:hypothetical protein
MMTLNISIPHFPALLRRRFLYQDDGEKTGYENVVVFGVRSVADRAIGFHVMTDDGIVRSNVPIHMLCWKDCPQQPLDFLQLWDCFSHNVAVTEFDFLKAAIAQVIFKDKTREMGDYMMTFDWFGNPWSDDPTQYKCGHLIKLRSGNFAIQPNNRIYWRVSAWTDKPIPTSVDHMADDSVYRCEIADRWLAPDGNKTYYEFTEHEP